MCLSVSDLETSTVGGLGAMELLRQRQKKKIVAYFSVLFNRSDTLEDLTQIGYWQKKSLVQFSLQCSRHFRFGKRSQNYMQNARRHSLRILHVDLNVYTNS